jgi:putative transposase
MAQLVHLSSEGLAEVEALLRRLRQPDSPPSPATAPKPAAQPKLAWPHSPTHRLSAYGTYFVTTGTYLKPHLFRGVERLDYLQRELLSHAKDTGWQLEAWAVFSNHYHFVAHASEGAIDLRVMLKELHRKTSIHLNELDGEPGRQVWHNFWDTELTIETSYFARLAYTHYNAVKHRLVADARHYRWCSAGWLERVATPAQVATMKRIKTDTVNVPDEYDPVV